MTKESPRVSKTLYTELKTIFSGCIAENGNSIDQKHFFLQTNEVGSGYQQNFMRKKSIHYFWSQLSSTTIITRYPARQDCCKDSPLVQDLKKISSNCRWKLFKLQLNGSCSCCSSICHIEKVGKLQYLSLMLLCLARSFSQSGSVKLLFHQFMFCMTYRTNIIVKQRTNITS